MTTSWSPTSSNCSGGSCEEVDRPLSFTVQQNDETPNRWRELVERIDAVVRCRRRRTGASRRSPDRRPARPRRDCQPAPALPDLRPRCTTSRSTSASPTSPTRDPSRDHRRARRGAGARLPGADPCGLRPDVPADRSAELRADPGGQRGRSGRGRGRRPGREDVRPDARRRGSPVALHAVDELRERRPRRRPGDDPLRALDVRALRCRGPLQRDLRRDVPDHGDHALDAGPDPRRAARSGVRRAPTDPADRRTRRVARPRRDRSRLSRGHQRDRPRPPGAEAATPRRRPPRRAARA